MSVSLWKRLKMSVFSPAMLVSVLAGLFFLTWNRVVTLVSYNLRYGSALTFRDIGGVFLDDISLSHALSGFDLFAPILAVLPAAAMFCGDLNSGYLRAVLCRERRRKYIRDTLLCSSISGGMAIFLPSLFSGVFYLANGKLDTLENRNDWGYSTAFDDTVYAEMQYVWGGLLLALLLMAAAFLFGAVWSDFGLLVSVLFPNKYLALASPFVCYFSLHLILYRLDFPLVFSPVNVLMPDAAFIPYILYPLVYQGVLLGFIVSLTVWLLERRLRDV